MIPKMLIPHALSFLKEVSTTPKSAVKWQEETDNIMLISGIPYITIIPATFLYLMLSLWGTNI